jgi:hypothetical protein
MTETNIKNLCCSRIIKYFCAAQKSLLLFCAAHPNKQKYFNAFALLWDDTKRSNCPGRAGFAKTRYMKSFSKVIAGLDGNDNCNGDCLRKKRGWTREKERGNLKMGLFFQSVLFCYCFLAFSFSM